MLLSLLFIGAMSVVIVGGIAVFGRWRSGRRITGPLDRSIDYDNPYGSGTYYFTNKRNC
jgi:hypothetical protein